MQWNIKLKEDLKSTKYLPGFIQKFDFLYE
jgi:hypothetical protein